MSTYVHKKNPKLAYLWPKKIQIFVHQGEFMHIQ